MVRVTSTSGYSGREEPITVAKWLERNIGQIVRLDPARKGPGRKCLEKVLKVSHSVNNRGDKGGVTRCYSLYAQAFQPVPVLTLLILAVERLVDIYR